jgi:hypothetical protein
MAYERSSYSLDVDPITSITVDYDTGKHHSYHSSDFLRNPVELHQLSVYHGHEDEIISSSLNPCLLSIYVTEHSVPEESGVHSFSVNS